VQAVADAANQIRLGLADVMIAAGTESMSVMPQMMGNKMAMNPAFFTDENMAIAYGMGLTAEKVAKQWKISREAQDAFAVESHQKACAAIAAGHFKAEISPYPVRESLPDLATGEIVCASALSIPTKARARRLPGQAGQAAPGLPCPWVGHGRQLLADVGRRRRRHAGLGKGAQGTQPDAAGPLRRLRRGRRGAGDHGHRPDRGDSQGAGQAGIPRITWTGSN
jgi:hypothetical protein